MHLRVATLATFVAAMCLTVSSAAATTPSALVLRYSFNTDSSVVIHDASAHGLHGTLINADPSVAFTKGAPSLRKGLQLVAPEKQYVEVPEAAPLDVNRYTLAAWVRYSGTSTADTKGRWEVLEKAGAYWLNIRTDGSLRAGGFYGGCDDSRYWSFLDSTRTVPVGEWTHIAATYNGARLVTFIDGVRAGSMAVSGATCANDEPLAVGAKNAPAKGILEAFYDGRLDEVRIYRKALSPERIAALASP